MSTGFWATSSSLYCSTLQLPGPTIRSTISTAARCSALQPLPLLPCRLHINAVLPCFTAVFVCILVMQTPQSSL